MVRKKLTKSQILNEVKEWFKNRSIDDLMALGIGSWSAWNFKTPESFLWGAVAYKLARTGGGTPPVSQIAGLAALGTLGLAAGGAEIISSVLGEAGEQVTKFIAAPISTPETDIWFEETRGKVPFHHWKRWKLEHPDEVWQG